MSLFKEKNKSKLNLNNSKNITIDAKHKKQLNLYENEKKKLPNLVKDFSNKKEEFDKLSKKEKKNLDDDELNRYFDLKEYIEKYERKIELIKKGENKNKYLLETSHLLFNYYDKVSGGNRNTKKYKSDINNRCVLDFFHNNQNNKKKEESDKTSHESDEISKSDIINSYLLKVEDNFIYPYNEDNINLLDYCKECKKEKTIITSEGIIVCTNCGVQDNIIIESDKPSYKDPPREISYFAYKRINHFNEWLAQFQAKESTEIPKEVFDKLLLEIKKERIENMALLSPYKLREILKKLKLNKYYEHVPHIINRLNGLPAPVMTRDTEEKLRMMFKEIQTPFLKYCPKDRKNFLSYSYVLHKFVQLLEMDEFLSCFPLLKSREKLHQQDLIWKKICEDLHWEFIKSL